jgi:chromate transporter
VAEQTRSHGITFRDATRVWAYIGLNTFGGPAGQIAVMHRELVERRRWVSEKRFLHALNYCMVLPGPEAQQLATYVGWLMHGVSGGAVAGVLFVLPGFVTMMALSIAYALYGDVTWVSGLLLGIQAAVVAIVIEAVIRIGRRTLRNTVLRVVAALSFLAIFLFGVLFPIIVVAAGLVGWLLGRSRPQWFPGGAGHDDAREASSSALLSDDERVPRGEARRALWAAVVCLVLWLTPVALLWARLGSDNVFAQEAWLFSKAAVVTFGGAYAVLWYVAQQAVGRYGWISPTQMITGLGLAETTPGPLIMVVQFVGFLAAYQHPGSLPPMVAGVLGALITVWVTFVPCFMFIFLGAPWVERLRDNHAISHALSAISAAVAGVVLNLALFFALHTAFGVVGSSSVGPMTLPRPDWSTVQWSSVCISVVAAVLVFRIRLGTLRVVGISAVIGAVLAVAGLT